MDEGQQRAGGCACGAVRYTLTGPPMITHGCHCSHCQRETGAACAVNMLYERDRVSVAGALDAVATPSASGKGQTILRCPACRVAVASHYPAGGEAIYFIRAGTLDDRTGVAPDLHIYTATKQDWLTLPDGVPAFAEFYDPKIVWSAQTMARWRAALKR